MNASIKRNFYQKKVTNRTNGQSRDEGQGQKKRKFKKVTSAKKNEK